MANVRVHNIVSLPVLTDESEYWFACRNRDCGYSIYGAAIKGAEELELVTAEAWCPAPFSDEVPFQQIVAQDFEVYFVRE